MSEAIASDKPPSPRLLHLGASLPPLLRLRICILLPLASLVLLSPPSQTNKVLKALDVSNNFIQKVDLDPKRAVFHEFNSKNQTLSKIDLRCVMGGNVDQAEEDVCGWGWG